MVLAALGGYAYQTRNRPAPAPAPAFFPCGTLTALAVRIEGPQRTLEFERPAQGADWQLLQPQRVAGDAAEIGYLVNALDALKVQNTIRAPGDAAGYGLDHPRETVTCRVKGGSSYTLAIGSQSFDSSGYYAQKSGDSRVYVISSVEVDQVDRSLATPPVKPAPSPTP